MINRRSLTEMQCGIAAFCLSLVIRNRGYSIAVSTACSVGVFVVALVVIEMRAKKGGRK